MARDHTALSHGIALRRWAVTHKPEHQPPGLVFMIGRGGVCRVHRGQLSRNSGARTFLR